MNCAYTVRRTTFILMVKNQLRWFTTITSERFLDHGMASLFRRAPLLLMLGSKPGCSPQTHWKRLTESLESQNRDHNRILTSRAKGDFNCVDPNDWSLLYDFLETENSQSLWSLLLHGQKDKPDAVSNEVQSRCGLQLDEFCGIIFLEQEALQSTTKVFDLLEKHRHAFSLKGARISLDNVEYTSAKPDKPDGGSDYEQLLSLAQRSQRSKLEKNLARIGELGLVKVEKHGKHLFIM